MQDELKEWVVDPKTGRVVLLGIDELEAQKAAMAMQPRPSLLDHIIEPAKSSILRASRDIKYLIKALCAHIFRRKT